MDKITLDAFCNVLRIIPRGPYDICSRMPWPKRSVLRFVETHLDEIEMITGIRLSVRRSDYAPSGRGAFGRLSAGSRAKTVSAAVLFSSKGD